MTPIRMALVALVLAVGGCQTTIIDQRLPEMTFAHLGPLRLDGSVLDIVTDYRAPLLPPNIEHMFQTSPEKAARQWANDRLKPAGSPGRIRFVVVNAAVTETPITIDHGFSGAFKKEQSERYDATLEASVEIQDSLGGRRGFASARVTRSTTVREDVSLIDREREWYALVEGLMKDFNNEIEKNMRQYLGPFLR